MKFKLFICFLVIFGFYTSIVQAADEAKITVLESLGTVTITSKSGDVISLKSGSKLNIGVHIVTGDDGTLLLKTEKGHTFRISNNTDFTLNAYYIKQSWFIKNKSKDVIRISLKKGKLRAKLEHLGRLKKASVRIKTPTAIAGIRGSDGIVDVDDAGNTEFTSLEGDCYIEVDGYESHLEPGQYGFVGNNVGKVQVGDADRGVADGLGLGLGGWSPSHGGNNQPPTDRDVPPGKGTPQGSDGAGLGNGVVGGASPAGAGNVETPDDPEAPLDPDVTVPGLDVDNLPGEEEQDKVNDMIEDVINVTLPEPPSVPDNVNDAIEASEIEASTIDDSEYNLE